MTTIFHEIIDDSLRAQQLYLQRNLNPDAGAEALRIAYQGVEGNFSQLAARKYFADRETLSTFTGYSTFADVVRTVEQGAADYGLLPVENTTAGVINEVYDLLLSTKLSIVGEEFFEIRHCLLAIEDVSLSKIRRVLSQWQALGQCSRFLAQLENCHKEPMVDTAMAVRQVKENQDLSQAAIASEEAAQLYGLKVIKRNITDQPENLTRFIVVAAKPVSVDLRIPAKTSLIIATAHEAGALLEALVVMQRHGINMTKLESRPRKGTRFDYVFYVDFEGNVAEPRVEDALTQLRGATSFLKILGTYPIEQRKKTAPTVETLVGSPRSDRASQDAREPATWVSDARALRSADSARPSPQLASREAKGHDTVLRIGDVLLGGPQLVVVAGPRAVESKEQILTCAQQVKECGGQVLSGGCFNTLDVPDGSQGAGFHGLGWQGLEMLAEAGRRYALPVLSEIMAPADVERAAELLDILMIGHLNMHNYPLLSEVGGVHRAVMLQRGMSASLEQLLDAAEFIMTRGNQQVILCEHGISSPEPTTRNTLDLGGVSILREITHLPIAVAPSRVASQVDRVLPLARAARAVGADAIMLELHPNPTRALSGAAQVLSFDEFRELVAELHQ